MWHNLLRRVCLSGITFGPFMGLFRRYCFVFFFLPAGISHATERLSLRRFDTGQCAGRGLQATQGVEKTFSPKAIQWPFVYPKYYKVSLESCIRPVKKPNGTSFYSAAFNASFELLWYQVLFYGLGYEYNYISKNEVLTAATVHRLFLNTGIILILDEREKHHFLFHFRPGLAHLRSTVGNLTRPGIGLGIGYEYSLNSRWLLSPEVLYYRFPIVDNYPYGFSGYMFGLRLTYGR